MVTAHSPSKNKKAALLLEDGTFSIGYWFGVPVKVSSEVVVSTFTGYPFMDAHDAKSEIPVDKWLTNSATLNERRCI